MSVVVDLHSHSNQSDGVLAPAEVAQRAHARGVTCWSLTDHDTLSGVEAAHTTATALGLRFVPGVEITAGHEGRVLHILGLGIDPAHEALNRHLAGIRALRHERAVVMGQRLQACGIDGALDGALAHAANPELIGRVHFARFLLEQGHCATLQQAFDRYLGAGRTADVPMQWPGLEAVVSWIRASGGVAVVAHPGRYGYSPRAEGALLRAFRKLGGVGLEVVTGSHSADEMQRYARLAVEHGLEASCGSDFHAPREGRPDLGSLPGLGSLRWRPKPVWARWIPPGR